MSTTQRSSPLLLAAVWLVVTLPMIWGLSYTIRNAMKLFSAQPAAAAVQPPAADSHAPAPKL